LIAFTAYNYLLSNASPVLATSYAFVNPIVAALLGVATGESWSHKLTIALLLICLGVIFVILGQNERKAAKPK
jgi:drug/metabolite transporter (DMT)-like permease